MKPKEMKKNIKRPPTAAGRRVPQRTCVACREVKAKRDLMRLVRTPQGDIEMDATGKKEGRGAYLCPRRECLEKALKSKQLENVLKCRFTAASQERLMKNGQELLKELSGKSQ
jgi:predicted RNA-binding protein YlxR (DUF448 family)